jgi:hypothetical protein
VRFDFLWRIFLKKRFLGRLRSEYEIFYWEVTFLRGFIEYYTTIILG